MRGGFAAALSAGYSFPSGAVGDSIGNGPEIEGLAFYQLDGLPVRIGAGASYAWFGLDGTDGTQKKLGVFGLAGAMIRDPMSTMTPYVQVRAGWTRFSDDVGFTDPLIVDEPIVGTRTRSGLELGAVVGVDIPVHEHFHLDVSGNFRWANLGDYEIGGTPVPRSDTSANGSFFGLRAGAVFLLR
jgi:hypothetical protein